MNILPKKRWHVRTRENIARVRRDEAKAAEEEKQKQLRIEIAEREARTELLRKRARKHYNTEKEEEKETRKHDQGEQHVNLFYEVEQNSFAIDKSNPEYEKEKKLEREKYEKQIGYLTYLGQDTNEITGNVSWYNQDPEEKKNISTEVSKKAKSLEDPLRDMRKYLGTNGIQKITTSVKNDSKEGVGLSSIKIEKTKVYGYHREKKKSSKKKSKKRKKKRKKRKHSTSSESSESQDSDRDNCKKAEVNIDALRAQRLKREMEERKRAELVLKKLKGEPILEKKIEPEIEQKFSSQFNPHLARQNYTRNNRDEKET